MLHLNRTGTVAFLAGTLLLCTAVQAEPGQTSPDADVNQADSDEIEEITVYGARPLINLRWQMHTTEKNFYAVFNTLNSNDDFDVECGYETRTGSRLTEYSCSARFVRDYRSQLSKQRQSGSVATPEKRINIPEKEREMREELASLIEKYPDLLTAFTDALDAKQVYRAEREKRCKGTSMFCGGE